MTCIKLGSDDSHFNVSLVVRDKVTRQCPQTTTFWRERKAEADSNRGPSAYQPNVLPLGQTGSQGKRRERNANKTIISKEAVANSWDIPYAVLGHKIHTRVMFTSYQRLSDDSELDSALPHILVEVASDARWRSLRDGRRVAACVKRSLCWPRTVFTVLSTSEV